MVELVEAAQYDARISVSLLGASPSLLPGLSGSKEPDFSVRTAQMPKADKVFVFKDSTSLTR